MTLGKLCYSVLVSSVRLSSKSDINSPERSPFNVAFLSVRFISVVSFLLLLLHVPAAVGCFFNSLLLGYMCIIACFSNDTVVFSGEDLMTELKSEESRRKFKSWISASFCLKVFYKSCDLRVAVS
ncbi:hypothetical protein V6N13_106395 [Hibiscus sabdariffa]